jgi:enoyl-CoA hydratase/carnithine racemase
MTGADVGGGAEPTRYEVVDGVAHVVIARPAKRNALSREVLDRLAAHAATAADDPRVGAVVVSGEGGHFSAGLDLADLAGLATADLDEAGVAAVQAVLTAYEELDVPTIAAIDGVCLGGGLQLALACHLRAVAPGARMAVLEPRWGLVPDLGATWRLPRLVGAGRATELILTSREVGAEEALAIGLAELSLGGPDPLEEAHALAARIAAGPTALRLVPRLVREAVGAPRVVALAAEARAQLRALAAGDLAAALHATGAVPGPSRA